MARFGLSPSSSSHFSSIATAAKLSEGAHIPKILLGLQVSPPLHPEVVRIESVSETSSWSAQGYLTV